MNQILKENRNEEAKTGNSKKKKVILSKISENSIFEIYLRDVVEKYRFELGIEKSQIQ